MSPRPRKASDDVIFVALGRAMRRLGPGELTLATVAREAGVTAGALTQRFGSKRALLLAFAMHAADGAGAQVAALRAQSPSALAAVVAYAECVAALATSPAALARNLAYLHVDLADPEFRAALAAQGRATQAALRALLDEARAAGELGPGTDTGALVVLLEAALGGALLSWALDPRTPAAEHLRALTTGLLAPYRMRDPAEADPSLHARVHA